MQVIIGMISYFLLMLGDAGANTRTEWSGGYPQGWSSQQLQVKCNVETSDDQLYVTVTASDTEDSSATVVASVALGAIATNRDYCQELMWNSNSMKKMTLACVTQRQDASYATIQLYEAKNNDPVRDVSVDQLPDMDAWNIFYAATYFKP